MAGAGAIPSGSCTWQTLQSDVKRQFSNGLGPAGAKQKAFRNRCKVYAGVVSPHRSGPEELRRKWLAKQIKLSNGPEKEFQSTWQPNMPRLFMLRSTKTAVSPEPDWDGPEGEGDDPSRPRQGPFDQALTSAIFDFLKFVKGTKVRALEEGAPPITPLPQAVREDCTSGESLNYRVHSSAAAWLGDRNPPAPSSHPHHELYTFCYWQIFWHSI